MKTFLDDQMIIYVNWAIIFISLFFFVFYYFFIHKLRNIWNKNSFNSKQEHFRDDIFVSVIIVGRNEASNLKKCISSILANDYPGSLFEVIYVDDHSSDSSIAELGTIKSENFSFFELKNWTDEEKLNSYKKMAISAGISKARGKIILLTDADAIAGKKWIECHADIYKNDNKVKLCTGPVIFFRNKGFLGQFQYYDLLATMGFTNGGISENRYFMANGANMSFLKEIYDAEALRSEYASGDDMFFVQDTAAKFPYSVRFIKSVDAAVLTCPENTFMSFLSQRLRWGTKSRGYADRKLKSILLFIFLTNLVIIINILWFLTYISIFSVIAMLLIAVKILFDIFFIRSVAHDLRQKIDFPVLTASLMLYPFYIVPMGLLSQVSIKYTWKGRRVK
jgi:cellulose synthase/poly-beta-1,6-N-acetylglucosamine synthase-like glycosyltransferase